MYCQRLSLFIILSIALVGCVRRPYPTPVVPLGQVEVSPRATTKTVSDQMANQVAVEPKVIATEPDSFSQTSAASASVVTYDDATQVSRGRNNAAGNDLLQTKTNTNSPDVKDASQANASSPYQTTYRVQRGDTLWSIAKYYYGDGQKWREIANINHIVDAKKLRIGQVLHLPQLP